MSWLVHGSVVLAGVAGERPLPDAAVLVESDTIAAVGPYAHLRAEHPAAQTLGGPGFALLPGLANAHDHGRGFDSAAFGVADEPLELWVLELERAAPGTEYLRVLLSDLQQLRAGITTTAHCLNAGPAAVVRAAAGEALRAHRASGIRAGLVLQHKDQNYLALGDHAFVASLPPAEQVIARAHLAAQPRVPLPDMVALARELRAEAALQAPLVRVLLGPGAPWRSSDAALQALRSAAEREELRLHMHLLESRHNRDHGLATFGESLVAHLDRLSWLDDRLTLAHGVWLSPADVDLLAAGGVRLSHNLDSNLRLRSGLAPLRAMLRAGLEVGLGLDSLAFDRGGDIWNTMRLALRLHAEPGVGGWAPSAGQLFRMAARHGALATLGAGDWGAIAPGAPADLVLVDLGAAGIRPELAGAPLLDRLVALAGPRCVDTVMVAGRVVLRHGQFTDVDERSVLRQAEEALLAYTDAAAETAERLRPLRPFLARFYATDRPPAAGDRYFDAGTLLPPASPASALGEASTAPIYRLYEAPSGRVTLVEFGPGGTSASGTIFRVDGRAPDAPPGFVWDSVRLADGRTLPALLAMPELIDGTWRPAAEPTAHRATAAVASR